MSRTTTHLNTSNMHGSHFNTLAIVLTQPPTLKQTASVNQFTHVVI